MPQPFEWTLVARRPVDLDVAPPPVAHHCLDSTLVTDHALVLRALHRLEQSAMHEPEMIAVTVVLGQHLPVGRAAMLDPASGQLDLPLGRKIAGAIDQRGGGAEVLGKGAAVGAEAREDEATIARHA